LYRTFPSWRVVWIVALNEVAELKAAWPCFTKRDMSINGLLVSGQRRSRWDRALCDR
jgi:hypothetical protein